MVLNFLNSHKKNLDNIRDEIQDATKGVVDAAQKVKQQHEELRKAKEEIERMYYIIRRSCDNAEGSIYYKEYDPFTEQYYYKFANKHLCELMFWLPAGCEVNDMTDCELIARFEDNHNVSHTFLDVIRYSDRFAKDQGIPTRFFEVGTIGKQLHILDTTKTPITKDGIHIGLVGISKDLGCISFMDKIEEFVEEGKCVELIKNLYWQKNVPYCNL